MNVSKKTFNDDCEYLKNLNLTMTITLEDYLASKRLIFECERGHKTTLTRTSFANKRLANNSMCTKCGGANSEEKFESWKKRVFDNCGHILLELKDRHATYECGTCGAQKSTFVSNLCKARTTKFCSSCIQEQTHKRPLKDVRKELDEIGMRDYELIRYLNNKSVTVKCPNAHEFIGAICNFRRDRRCPTCACKRREITNLETYGVECVFKSKEIKEKIKQTCVKKFGVNHHMKNEEIREKQAKTMIKKYGERYAFHTEAAIEESKKVCLKLYGANFAMQDPKEFCRRIEMVHKKKPFTFPSGRIDYVSGFEPLCLEQLIKTHCEKDIVTNTMEIPNIRYKIKNKFGQLKDAVYYPDIMVGSKLIEVKSEYYLKLDYKRNMTKFLACRDCGYDLSVWVYTDRGVLDYIIRFFTNDFGKKITTKYWIN